MGYDPFAAISEAQINVLCLPATKISRDQFEDYVKALQAFSIVSLKNIKHNGTTDNDSIAVRFASGSVLLDFSSHYGRNDAFDLYPLMLNRQPQVLIGLVNGETLSLNRTDDRHNTIGNISESFQRHASAYRHVLFSSTIVFGGSAFADVEDCSWVDIDGNGPTIQDVLADIIKKLYQRQPLIVNGLQNQISQSRQTNGTRDGSQRDSSSNTSESLPAKSDSALARGSNLPVTSSTQNTADSQGNDVVARHAIIQGLLSLQIGQWPEAMRLLADGATGASSLADHLWHAKAVEGILVCMILFAWTHTEFNIPQICYPGNDRNIGLTYPRYFNTIVTANRTSSISLFANTTLSSTHSLANLVPHLVATVIGLYERAASSNDKSILVLLLYEAKVRWTNMFIMIAKHGGVLDDSVLQHVVEGHQASQETRSKSTSSPTIQLDITILSKILGDCASQAQGNLSVQQAAFLNVAIATSLSLLGFERKQGFHLKELLQRLGPRFAEARRLGAAEIGVHPATSLPPVDPQRKDAMLSNGSGIQSVLNIIVDVFNLPSRKVGQASLDSGSTERLLEALKFWALAKGSGDLFLKIEILNLCIDISDAIPDPGNSLYFITCLLQITRRAMTVEFDIANVSPVVSTADQLRSLDGIKRAVDIAEKHHEQSLRAEYWDKFLVRSVQLLEDPQANNLIPHAAQEIRTADTGADKTGQGPFIFNPFAKVKSSSSIQVVTVGELAQFVVVLQNSLDVDVEIENIMLMTEGCKFIPSHHSIVLGPICSQTFILSGIAEESGDLKIIGCKATIRNCYEEIFLILPDEWKAVTNLKHQLQRIGSSILDEIKQPRIHELTVKVIDPLPFLTILSSSLPQPSLMLLEGERMTFELTVRNTSTQDIDLVLVTFEDSVKKRLEEALTNKDINPADLYEIQHQLKFRPTLSWLNQEENVKIAGGQNRILQVEVYGHAGLTFASIMVNYAQLGRSRAEVTETFYTRQLSYTLTITVNGSIDVPRCLVLPLQSDLNWTYSQISEKQERDSKCFEDTLTTAASEEQCVFLLDIRNVWPQPLEVDFNTARSGNTSVQSTSPQEQLYTTSAVLQPGQMSRILLLIPRTFVSDPYTVVPSLDTKRQFVVSASRLTLEAEAASRESFWYREKLLKYIKATWTEQAGTRTGQLDLRKSVRLNSRMIDALKIDHVKISFTIQSASPDNNRADEANSIASKSDSHFTVARNQFATLVTTVYNRSNCDLKLLLRLQPSLRNQPHNIALDISKRFAWSGTLQRPIQPSLKAGESRSINLDFVALAVGEYDVNAAVEEIVRLPNGDAQLSGVASASERRIWHARHACSIDAL